MSVVKGCKVELEKRWTMKANHHTACGFSHRSSETGMQKSNFYEDGAVFSFPQMLLQ